MSEIQEKQALQTPRREPPLEREAQSEQAPQRQQEHEWLRQLS
jgi:hypothetical protein